MTLHTLLLVVSGAAATAGVHGGSPVQGSALFVEVGAARGIQPYVMAPGLSAGIAAEDYDGDGDIDLFVPNGLGAADQFYINDGTGLFVESAARVGLDVDGNHRAALWFDADGDGDLDLLTVGDCYENTPCTGASSLRLHLHLADGTFRDVTEGAGLGRDLTIQPDTHVGGVAVGDLDSDGDLDIFVCFWEGLSFLYVNDGHGRFVDRGLERGIQLELNHWQPVLHDFNGDGHLDIFQAVDFSANRLWINQGDGTFVDRAPQAGVDNAFNEMGVSLADFDRDGDLDLYVTNIFTTTGRHNLLYERRGTQLAFDEVSAQMGVQDSGCGWGNTFIDVDHDGWLDLAATNSCAGGHTRFFWNRLSSGAGFAEVTARAGIDGYNGTGLVAFDMDGDGDRDLAQASVEGLRLFENTHVASPERGYLVIRPRMRGANPHSAGAVVTLLEGGRRTARAILAGSSIMSQEPAEAHFGLGPATFVDVRIDWPDGSHRVLEDVAPNQVLTIVAP